MVINRYIHLNPVRVRRLGGHEGRTGTDPAADRELIKARVAALDYPWSSYRIYAGKAKNPGWLSTDSIYSFFGAPARQNLARVYRRELEKMAALGDWQADWKHQVSASVLLGSEAFVRQTHKLLRGNRAEQPGLRQSERLTLDWKSICAAVSEVWKCDWCRAERQTRKRCSTGGFVFSAQFCWNAPGGTGGNGRRRRLPRGECRNQTVREPFDYRS